jgi:hypothetical protein
VIAQWCWDLVEPYLEKTLQNRGLERPTKKDLLREFARVWPEFTATIGVQEPWQGTIHFKWLARVPASGMDELLRDPVAWLREHYGGGKFKLNLHHGLHFVNTRNFRPDGDPLWKDVPALSEE